MPIGSLFGLIALATQVSGDSVYGVVRDALTGNSLPAVEVEAGPLHQTSTDREGEYVVGTKGPRLQHLRFARSGYEALSVDINVPEHHSLRVDVALTPLPVTLPSISVASATADSAEMQEPSDDEIGLRRYSREALHSDPLVTPDDPLMAAARELSPDGQPGALRPLRVRGGSSDQNLVLLDGLPIYGLAHEGGSAGPFDPDLLGRIDLHTAAPPAEYSGRLSSVLDVHLRPPPGDHGGVGGEGGTHASGAWDLVAVRQSVTTPLGPRGALQVSLRRSYRALFPGDLVEAEPNGFGDALLHTSFGGSRDRLSLYATGGSDHLAFLALPSLTDAPSSVRNEFNWSHGTAGVVWRHGIGSGHPLTARVWDAGANAAIAWGAGAPREAVTSTLHDWGASIELSPRDPGAPAMLGLSVSRVSTSYMLGGIQATRLASAPLVAGVFGQGRWRAGQQWTLAAGLRVNSADLRDILLEPRLSGRWEVARGVSLLAGYSRIHQFVQSLRNEESPLDYAVSAELPLAIGGNGLRPARADQLSAALAVRLDERASLRVDAYTRSLRNLLVVPAATIGPFAGEASPSGSGRARGVEVDATRRGGILDLHLTLGMEAGERRVNGTSFTPGALRSRWLAAGVGYHIDGRTVARLAVTVASDAATTLLTGNIAWGAPGALAMGNEILGTPEILGGPLNRDRLAGYRRIDAGLVRDWPLTAWGKLGIITTSLTVSNLLDTRNPLAYAAGDVAGVRRALDFPSRTLGVQVGWRF